MKPGERLDPTGAGLPAQLRFRFIIPQAGFCLPGFVTPKPGQDPDTEQHHAIGFWFRYSRGEADGIASKTVNDAERSDRIVGGVGAENAGITGGAGQDFAASGRRNEMHMQQDLAIDDFSLDEQDILRIMQVSR